MAHPMMGYLRPRQMSGIFDTLIDSLKQSTQQGLDKAKQEAISKTFQTIASEPAVQQAVIESGNDAAIQSLAQQLKNAQVSTYNYVKSNPMTTAMIVGGIAVGGIALFMLMRKR